MADKKKSGGGGHISATGELKGFIAILIVLWLLWFFFARESPSSEKEKIFVQPSTQSNTPKGI